MTEIPPVDELRTAAAVLRDMPGPARAVIVTKDEDGHADEHVVAVCDAEHAPPAIIDRHGCCQDCRFIFSYDPELAAAIAVLLAAVGPFAALLDAENIKEDETFTEASVGEASLSVARAINGAAGQTAERTL